MSPGRLIFMAQPPATTRCAMEEVVDRHGLNDVLGDAGFASTNWHQSCSDRYADQPEVRAKLLAAGAAVLAASFTMALDRIAGERSSPQGIHWAFRASSRPQGLSALLAALRLALRGQGIIDQTGHTAHVTISYRAPSLLPRIDIEPIEWMINELMLVRGRGHPYRYDVLERWPLKAALDRPSPQLHLL